MASNGTQREQWGSGLGFVLAAAGSAIGLGNIWRFPYITGENGGGAFVLIYLLCILIIGMPVMLCEITLGRHTQRNPVGAIRAVAPSSSTIAHALGGFLVLTGVALLLFQHWGWAVICLMFGAAIFRFSWTVVGAMGVFAGFIILSFYSVVAGWTLGYSVQSISGRMSTDPRTQSSEVLAHVILTRAQAEFPEDAAEHIDARDDLSPVDITRAVEQARQAHVIRNVNQAFGITLEPPPEPMNPYQFASYFDKALADAVPRDLLLDRLAEPHGGAETRQAADGSTHLEYPRGLHSEVAGSMFNRFMKNGAYAVTFHFFFMLLCVGIVCLGVQGGIEKTAKILMPTLLLLIVALIVRGLTLPGAMEGVRFYLSPDFSKLNPKSVLEALGHAFFSLSVGMGAMITYGSYVQKEENIFVSTLSIVSLDTILALLAGLAIFPALFAGGFDPGAGPGLVFITLPAVFNQMPLGAFWAAVFFVLLLIAALTSGVSLLEVVTAYLVDEHGWSRKIAASVIGLFIFLIGAVAALSVADWSRVLWLQQTFLALFQSTKGSFFDVLDNLGSNWLLPLGGLFIAIFVGWVWGTRKAIQEIRHGSHNFGDVHLVSLLAGLKDDPSHNSDVHVLTLASVWGIFIRFISPIAVLIAFLDTLGWLDITGTAPSTALPPPDQAEEVPADNVGTAES